MAKVDIKMPDEFLERMSRLGKDFDTVAESVLEAGGEVVLQKVQSNLSAVVGSGTKYESRSTGELESALGLTPAKTDKDGNHNVKVGFAEPRSDGGSNAKLANILEYGKHDSYGRRTAEKAGHQPVFWRRDARLSGRAVKGDYHRPGSTFYHHAGNWRGTAPG